MKQDGSNGVKTSAGTGSVAMFTFEELCGDPLSAADYLEITKNFDTVFISDIPNLSLSEKDKVHYNIHPCCAVLLTPYYSPYCDRPAGSSLS